MSRLVVRVSSNNRRYGKYLLTLQLPICVWAIIHNTGYTSAFANLWLLISAAYLTVHCMNGRKVFFAFWKKLSIAVPLLFILFFTFIFRGKNALISATQQFFFYFTSIYVGYAYVRCNHESVDLIKDPLLRNWGYFWLICASYGLIEYVTGHNAFTRFYTGTFSGMGQTVRIASCYMHSIPYANAMIIAICVYFCRKKNLLLFGGITVINIILTGSRSGWVALVVILAVCLYHRHKHKITTKTFLIGIGGLAAVTVFLFTPFAGQIMQSVGQRMGSASVSISNSIRTETLGYVLYQIVHSSITRILFGHGYGAASEAIQQASFRNAGAVDNTFLYVFYDYGLVIAILLVVFVLVWIVRGIRARKTANVNLAFYSSVIIGQTIMSLFYDFVGWKNVSFALFVIVGMSMATQEYERQKNHVQH